MAEQFFKAYAVWTSELCAIVGSKNEVLVQKALQKQDLVAELDTLLNSPGVL